MTATLAAPAAKQTGGNPNTLGMLAGVRRALRTPGGRFGLILIVVMLILGLGAQWIAPVSPEANDFSKILLGPGPGGLLGSDTLGRDLFSRILYGIQASILVGVAAVALAVLIGVPVGLLSGYYHRADSVIGIFIDVMLSFPNLIVAVALATAVGASGQTAAVAIAIGAIPGFVRIIRGEVLRLRGLDFVSAAIADGARDFKILVRHILPNASSALLVQITIAIPGAVLGEAVLSFLGVGLAPPASSLGILLADAQQYVRQAWWLAVFPGVAIIGLALSFNLFGDALRDALDPKGRRR